MYSDFEPSLYCFRCLFFYIDNDLECFCTVSGFNISDYVLNCPCPTGCFYYEPIATLNNDLG